MNERRNAAGWGRIGIGAVSGHSQQALLLLICYHACRAFKAAQSAVLRRSFLEIRRLAMALRKFIIERDIAKVGTLEREQLRGAAAKSNEALRQLGPDIQWVESYVADNKTFCVYLAKDEAIIHKHAEVSGFPATKVTEVKKMIDPTTAGA
jgi:hypothetical protein